MNDLFRDKLKEIIKWQDIIKTDEKNLFLKKLFLNCFLPLSKLFNLVAELLCLSSASSNDKCCSCTSLKKIGKKYSLKL